MHSGVIADFKQAVLASILAARTGNTLRLPLMARDETCVKLWLAAHAPIGA